MKGKKILVTGGGGFIGTNLVYELIKQGADVKVIELPTKDCKHLPKNVSVIKADINKKIQLKNAFKDVEIVFHLAARTDLNGTSLDDYKTNTSGTKNVIEEAVTSKKLKRIVVYSTQLVTGLFNETRFIDETEQYKTKTIYGQSKIQTERITVSLCNKYKVPYTIIRPTSVYGPYGEEPYKNYFKMVKIGKYFHFGKADNLVSMAYVKNLVNLTILLSDHSKAKNEIFYGTDFHPYTMRQFTNAVATYYDKKIMTVPYPVAFLVAYILGIVKFFGIPVPLYPFRLKNIVMNYCYDIQKSVRLGYNPEFDLTLGIKETLDWYEKNKQL